MSASTTGGRWLLVEALTGEKYPKLGDLRKLVAEADRLGMTDRADIAVVGVAPSAVRVGELYVHGRIIVRELTRAES